MASTCLSISSLSGLVDVKAPLRQSAAGSLQCVTLPTLPPPPVQSQNRPWRTIAYCRKITRNVMAMATGDAPAELDVATTELPGNVMAMAAGEAPAELEVATTELPDIVKTVQGAWDKVEEKYAVSSLAVAGVVALWVLTGMISAIDRLPLVPGVLELVGIGYTGWFVYKNLIFKLEREALIQKITDTYKEIIGGS